MNSITEEQRGKQTADYEIGDGQVCQKKVEGFMSGFVSNISMDHDTSTERTEDDRSEIQRADEHCSHGVLLVELHGLTVNP